MVEKIYSFAELRKPAEIARETAVLLRTVKSLAERPQSCGVPGGFQSLESLATVVSDLNDQPDSLLSSVTAFLAELQENSARLVISCTEDSQYNRNFITAIGDLMEELADLSAALGDVETEERTRYGKVLTVGVMREF